MAHIVPVKYFYGGSIPSIACHPTYPIHNLSAGSWISVLDACLETGFGEVTITNLVVDSDGIATATSVAHGYTHTPLVLKISGADTEAINGEWELTGYTADTLILNTVDSGITSATITGASIKIKVAPLGWSKIFYDAPNSIAVYRSNDPYSRRHFLRVDDADNSSMGTPRQVFFRGFESMTTYQDVGTYPFPLQSNFPRGLGMNKDVSTGGVYLTASSANRSWSIVGTSRQFYWSGHIYNGTYAQCRQTQFFGDMVSYVPSDIGGTILSANPVVTSTGATQTGGVISFGIYTDMFCPRNSKRGHSLSDQRLKMWMAGGVAVLGQIGLNAPVAEPDIYSNRLILCRPIFVTDEQVATSIRGEMPGMACSFSNIAPVTLENNTIITTDTGERFMIMFTNAGTAAAGGYFLLSIDRDWNIPVLS